MRLDQLIEVFESLWPTRNAEDWDVVGLVSGHRDQEISKILLTVDVTSEVVEQAIELDVDLILAHHPMLLKGLNTLSESTSKGSLLSQLIREGIAVYSAHTNADVQLSGTSATLAKAIGLESFEVLAETEDGLGIGVIGQLDASITLGDLAGRLNLVLPSTASGVRVAGAYDDKVKTIALCAGAGDSYLQLALDSKADVYITSDLRHHPAQEILETAKARNQSFALIDISHWAAEYLWLEQAKTDLSNTGVELVISDIRTDVFDFLMNLPKGEK